MSATPHRIALTPGEPAGIGPDLCLLVSQNILPVEPVTVCDPELLAARAQQLDLTIHLREFRPEAPPQPHRPGELAVLPVSLKTPVQCGHPDPANAGYVLAALDEAVRGCRNNVFAALVTGPVHKGIINAAGIPFTGHTEYLAARTGSGDAVMLLCAGTLRVALATTHLPLREVSAAITGARLHRTLAVLHRELRGRFGIAEPRILVCGLNPHAGEGGHMGREELEVIGPAVEQLRDAGMNLEGPLPADTVFTPACLERADAVLAMYHDQGLPVIKHAAFGSAVNVTLGLPIIRTSVDHGTALKLAGTGRASTGSLLAALHMACDFAAAGGRR